MSEINQKLSEMNVKICIGEACYWIEIRIASYIPPVISVGELETFPDKAFSNRQINVQI